MPRYGVPHGCRCTRTFLGAPPTPRFGVSEATMQTPGAKCAAGTRECVLFEIVRPGMEDPNLQKNRKIQGSDQPARANSPTPSCVPDAVQRGAERSGAPLIRDRHGLERSRVCSAPLRAALRPGHESPATQHPCATAWSARSTNLRLYEIAA